VDQKAGFVMDAELWKWGWWIVATLGIAGTIALFAFFPAAASIALNAVVRFFSLVLSYRIGCAVVAAILAALAADYWRHSTEDAKHAAEVAAFEAAQDARDKRIASETRELVWKEIADATAENAVTDKDVKDFTDALPKPPETGNLFRVGTDACRLRHIYGQVECGPHGVERMPKADPRHEGVRDRRAHGLSNLVRRSRGSDQQGQ
jgi:hypothetical protein